MWYNHPRNRVKNIQYIKVKSEKLNVKALSVAHLEEIDFSFPEFNCFIFLLPVKPRVHFNNKKHKTPNF